MRIARCGLEVLYTRDLLCKSECTYSRNADSCAPVGEGEEVEREVVRYTETEMSAGV